MAFKIPGFSRRTLRPYMSEFLGMVILIVLGCGVVAQCLLSDWLYGAWLSINLAWGAAVCLTGFLSDPSPSVNPAVLLAMAIVRPSPGQWKKLPGKILAQLLGSFVGAALVYVAYRSAILSWDPETTIPSGSILSPKGHNSAGIFATYPSSLLQTNWEAVFIEGLASAVLMFGIMAISDPANSLRFPAPHIATFFLLFSIGASMGWQTGYALNPSRDLGPRMFSAIIYGKEVFTAHGYYFLVPLLSPFAGCLVGATAYDAFLYDGEGSTVTDAMDKAEGRDGSLRLD